MRFFKSLFSKIIVSSFLISLFAYSVFANETQSKTVRVGWYDSFFNLTDNFGRKSGYGYEYQQKIAHFTGWEYEYVTGNWSELYNMLINGEIDLLSDVSITEEQKDKMLFSSFDMGEERYYAYISYRNSSINSTDLSTFNGKTVGVMKSSIHKKVFQSWAKQNNITADIVELSYSLDQAYDSLDKGEIDVFISTEDKFRRSSVIPVCLIGTSPFYFAVNKNRPDLQHELDIAMSKIQLENRYYNQILFNKYVNYGSIGSFLSSEELGWIYKNKKIRIAYKDNYLPFCSQDSQTGNLTGILKDLLESAFLVVNNYSLQFEPIPYTSITEALQALTQGKVDCVFPVNLSMYDGEQLDLLSSDTIISTGMEMIYKGEQVSYFSNLEPYVFAVTEGNISIETYIKDNFPNSSILRFENSKSCIKAIIDDRADCFLISKYRSNQFKEEYKKKNFNYYEVSDSMNFSFVVRRSDLPLVSIMNKIIHGVPNTLVHTGLVEYSRVEKKVTTIDYIRDNVVVFMFVFLIVLGTITILLFVSLRTAQLARVSEKKMKEVSIQAEAANKSKTYFLSNMSHDIRTPMNAIIGFTKLMEAKKNDPKIIGDYLIKIQKSGEYLLSIINNVLEIARIDSGKEEVDETFTDLYNPNCSIASLFDNEFNAKNITFDSTMNITHRYIFADMNKIREITMNLLSNAVKYTPNGGTILLKFEEIESEKEGYATYVNSVIDNGIGMSKEFQKHIFESFSREKNSTESKVNGTGLGMTIVKRLIDLLDGRIEIESEVGRGSTFRVIMSHKIVENPQDYLEQEEIKKNNRVNLSGKRILLAEDNELNSEIAMTILEGYGAKVELAQDGISCVDMLNRADPGYFDLILMDIQMPNMNGYEATKLIRRMKDYEKSEIPIIAMTANAFAEDKKNALTVGMNGHIAKPIDIKELQNTLTEVFSQKL